MSNNEQIDPNDDKIIQKSLNLFLNPLNTELNFKSNPIKKFISSINKENDCNSNNRDLFIKRYCLHGQNRVNQNCKSCIKMYENTINTIQNKDPKLLNLKFQSPDNQVKLDKTSQDITNQVNDDQFLKAPLSPIVSKRDSHLTQFRNNQSKQNLKPLQRKSSNPENFINRQNHDIKSRRSYEKQVNHIDPLKDLNQEQNYPKKKSDHIDKLLLRQNERSKDPNRRKMSNSFKDIMNLVKF